LWRQTFGSVFTGKNIFCEFIESKNTSRTTFEPDRKVETIASLIANLKKIANFCYLYFFGLFKKNTTQVHSYFSQCISRDAKAPKVPVSLEN
jgi:pantothenate kinase